MLWKAMGMRESWNSQGLGTSAPVAGVMELQQQLPEVRDEEGERECVVCQLEGTISRNGIS
jgi:hypothetical protein